MARRRRSRRISGAAASAARAPARCKRLLSVCMKRGGRRNAGRCMRMFNACKR